MAGQMKFFGSFVLAGLACMVLPQEADSQLFCRPNGGADAVDLSTPVDRKFLEKMKEIGVSTVIRYYDHLNETIVGKTLRRKERDLILGQGFQIAVVFQHHNDRFSSFTEKRGALDSGRAVELAGENLQPKGSTIFFGVDGPWGGKPEELAAIKGYFRAAANTITENGYAVGVYGSGLICKELLSEGLATHCWLANAMSWPLYDDFALSEKWSLIQFMPGDCGGRNVDFNMVNKNIDFSWAFRH
jgi:hypothetical protein